MRRPFAAPPEAGELGAMPVHVVLRDFPEALAVLRRLRVDPGVEGADPLGEAVGSDGVAGVEEALAWRHRRARGPRESEEPREWAK